MPDVRLVSAGLVAQFPAAGTTATDSLKAAIEAETDHDIRVEVLQLFMRHSSLEDAGVRIFLEAQFQDGSKLAGLWWSRVVANIVAPDLEHPLTETAPTRLTFRGA